MTCLACDTNVTQLDKDWAFRTGHHIEPTLGHLPCKGKDFDIYFPSTFRNYANGKLCCTECNKEVPKDILDKSCFISGTFKTTVERDLKFYHDEIERVKTQQSAAFQPSNIVTDNIEAEFLKICKGVKSARAVEPDDSAYFLVPRNGGLKAALQGTRPTTYSTRTGVSRPKR